MRLQSCNKKAGSAADQIESERDRWAELRSRGEGEGEGGDLHRQWDEEEEHYQLASKAEVVRWWWESAAR